MQAVSEGFITACKASTRFVISKIEICWDGVNWIDESQHLISHSGMLAAKASGEELVEAGRVGTASVILRNNTGRFNRYQNLGDPLANYISDEVGPYEKGVRLYQGFTIQVDDQPVESYVRIFTGVIFNWIEDSYNKQITFELRDQGSKYLQHKISSILYMDERPDEWITRIAGWAGIPSGDLILDPGIFRIPWLWLDDESAVAEIWDTARADGGMAFFDQLGKLRFENALHYVATEHLTPVWDFTESEYQALAPQNSPDDLVTKIVVEWSGRLRSTVQTLYSLDVEKVINPGQTITWEARFQNPAYWILSPVNIVVPTFDPEKPIYINDYVASSIGGFDMTTALTIILTPSKKFAQRCEVSVTNTNPSFISYLIYFQIRGEPLFGGPTEQVTVDVVNPPVDDTRLRSVRGNVYLQSSLQGEGLAHRLAQANRRIRSKYLLNGVFGIPQLELMDRVMIRNPISSLPLEGLVLQIAWRFSASEGFSQDVTVQDAMDLYDQDDYFIIGETALGAHGRCWY